MTKEMREHQFDELLKGMREESATAKEIEAARGRVRDRLTGSTSKLCPVFRPQLGDYLENRLTDSRRLLLEDHLGRCVPCRHALAEARGRAKGTPTPAVGPRRRGWTRWAVAAGVVLALLYLGHDQIDRALAPSGARATVLSVSGEVQALPDGALEPGTELFEAGAIRTGAGAHAILRLADGSRVEVNQRTKLSVHSAWSGQTVRLDYGDLLIEATPRGRDRLRVVTRDSMVAVKGTIFAVSSATAGSLVSVVEGAVEVRQSGLQKVLEPGQQLASNSALEGVGIEQAIAWSQEAERYYTVLAELVRLEKDLAELAGPELRTQSRLVPHLPAETRVYSAIPNLTGTIDQALSLLDQRAEETQVLDEWWSSEAGLDLREMLDRVRAITPLLGEEVLFVLAADPNGSSDSIPLLLAEVQPGKEDDLHEVIGNLESDSETAYEVDGGLLLISDSAENLMTLSASLGGGGSSAFAAKIASRYEGGVGWLTAVDVAALGFDLQLDGDAGQVLGLPTMHHLFLEQSSGDGPERSEATLSFTEGRMGMASWLASPGPAGSAEYASSDAAIAVSASVRAPGQAFDEILSRLSEDSELATEIHEFETATGISIGLDIAAALGTDFTFAVERPSLPTPGWIVVFETINPVALDEAARRWVEAHNDLSDEAEMDHSMTFTEEAVSGRAWKSIHLSRSGGQGSVQEPTRSMELHWTYDRGYLIASTDRALAMRAIAVRDSGSPLIYTDAFQRRFPVTSNLHHSGFLWFNANGVVADLASIVESPVLQNLLESRESMLVVFDGEAERIHAASRTGLTSALLNAMLLGGFGHAAPPSDDSTSDNPNL